MAHYASKGWYVQQLKERGINYHPTDKKKLETYRAAILQNFLIGTPLGVR
ncbi:YflJ family protein [Sutcliffiella cohnii]